MCLHPVVAWGRCSAFRSGHTTDPLCDIEDIPCWVKPGQIWSTSFDDPRHATSFKFGLLTNLSSDPFIFRFLPKELCMKKHNPSLWFCIWISHLPQKVCREVKFSLLKENKTFSPICSLGERLIIMASCEIMSAPALNNPKYQWDAFLVHRSR